MAHTHEKANLFVNFRLELGSIMGFQFCTPQIEMSCSLKTASIALGFSYCYPKEHRYRKDQEVAPFPACLLLTSVGLILSRIRLS